MTMHTGRQGLLGQRLRQRFWSRLRELGLIRQSELIRVHRLAQQRRMTPEEAVVALGMLTDDEVLAITTGNPSRASA